MSSETTRGLAELIRSRVSVEEFDPDRSLSAEEIVALVEDAAQAPSSFNIQHWRFVAVRRPEDKQRLGEAAFGQKQVTDAAVTFIVLGDTRGVEKLPAAMDQAVERGTITRGQADGWIAAAQKIYADGDLARAEALRSATLAAMVLMLSAEARGLASCPLGGFSAGSVMREFDIDDRYLPVMLLAVGYPAAGRPARKPRFPVGEVLSFDRADF